MHQQKLWKINLYKKDMLEEIKESAEIFVCDCNSREHQIVFQYDLMIIMYIVIYIYHI
jgi:hypothetical protein